MFRWLFLLILSLIILIPMGVIIFFDPNEFKPQITAFIQEKTGLPLEIQGEMSVHFYPWVGLTAHDIQLNQPEGFGKGLFLKANELGFKIPLREIIQSHFFIESLVVTNLELNLIKHQDGKKNWESFAKPKQSNEKQNSAVKQSKKIQFSLDKFQIRQAALNYQDQQQKQTFSVSQLDLNGTGKRGEAGFPFNSQFDLKIINNQQEVLTGKAKLHGQFSTATQAIVNSEFKLNFTGMPIQKADVTTQIISTADKLTFNNIDFKTDNIHITGMANLPNNQKLPITFKLDADEINLDNLAKGGHGHSQNNHSAASASQTAKPNATNKPRTLSGEFNIQNLKVKSLSLQQVKGGIRKENSLLVINPLTATLYQGNLNTQVRYDLNTSASAFQGKITELAIAPFLSSLNQPPKLSGKGNFDFNLQQAKNGLNGTTKFQIKAGTLQGIDINYYLDLAASTLKKQTVTATDNKATAFDSITGNLFFNNNVMDNSDLLMITPDSKVNGDGSINLNSKTLEYKLQAWRIYHDNQPHPNALPLAIRIKGPLDHPKVQPDIDLYVKTLLERELKKEANKQIERQLGKILKTPENDPQSEETTELTPEKQLQKKLERELDKGLKKILKF